MEIKYSIAFYTLVKKEYKYTAAINAAFCEFVDNSLNNLHFIKIHYLTANMKNCL